MKSTTINSYADLRQAVSGTDRSFLLLYKGGADQSECALKRISELESGKDVTVMTADVNIVRDIHSRLEVDTAPSLVVFRQGNVVNIIKGCQTSEAYDSILSGRGIGNTRNEKGSKARQVTVYTTPTCSWCTTLKTYLDQHGIRYREVNVASDTSAAEAMVVKSGQQGVPQTNIGGEMVIGFDKAKINRLLEIQG
jgi:glutaredoxin-like YruB-family protein